MNGYQAGISRFEGMEVKVFGVSTDSPATLSHWSKEMSLTFPLLSDQNHRVSKAYGILMEERGIASRVTFVIDPDGKIAHIEEGNAAVDPTGAETACKRIKGK